MVGIQSDHLLQFSHSLHPTLGLIVRHSSLKASLNFTVLLGLDQAAAGSGMVRLHCHNGLAEFNGLCPLTILKSFFHVPFKVDHLLFPDGIV